MPAPSNDNARWMSPLGWGGTFISFAAAAGLLLAIVRLAIPLAAARTGIEPLAWWFVLTGLGVFLPLALVAVLLLRQESLDGIDIWRDRLRFRAMRAPDWRAAIITLVVAGALSAVAHAWLESAGVIIGRPAEFLTPDPIGAGRRWLFALWLPFFALNVLSQELLWRGVLLPRQEAALGERAWIANAAGSALVCSALGAAPLMMFVPSLVAVPWIAHRQRSTWCAVVVHAGLQGTAFLAMALGIL